MLNRLIAWWWGFGAEGIDYYYRSARRGNYARVIKHGYSEFYWEACADSTRAPVHGIVPTLWSAMRAARKAAGR